MFNKKSKIELNKDLEKESFKRITCSFYRYCEINNVLQDHMILDGFFVNHPWGLEFLLN